MDIHGDDAVLNASNEDMDLLPIVAAPLVAVIVIIIINRMLMMQVDDVLVTLLLMQEGRSMPTAWDNSY